MPWSFTLYAQTQARHLALLRELKEKGEMVDVVVTDSNGGSYTKRIVNPAGKLATQLENTLRAMLKEFSATPASRERTKPAKAAPPKPPEVPPGHDPNPILLAGEGR